MIRSSPPLSPRSEVEGFLSFEPVTYAQPNGTPWAIFSDAPLFTMAIEYRPIEEINPKTPLPYAKATMYEENIFRLSSLFREPSTVILARGDKRTPQQIKESGGFHPNYIYRDKCYFVFTRDEPQTQELLNLRETILQDACAIYIFQDVPDQAPHFFYFNFLLHAISKMDVHQIETRIVRQHYDKTMRAILERVPGIISYQYNQYQVLCPTMIDFINNLINHSHNYVHALMASNTLAHRNDSSFSTSVSFTDSILKAKHFASSGLTEVDSEQDLRSEKTTAYVYLIKARGAIGHQSLIKPQGDYSSTLIPPPHLAEREMTLPGGLDWEDVIAYRKIYLRKNNSNLQLPLQLFTAKLFVSCKIVTFQTEQILKQICSLLLNPYEYIAHENLLHNRRHQHYSRPLLCHNVRGIINESKRTEVYQDLKSTISDYIRCSVAAQQASMERAPNAHQSARARQMASFTVLNKFKSLGNYACPPHKHAYGNPHDGGKLHPQLKELLVYGGFIEHNHPHRAQGDHGAIIESIVNAHGLSI